MKKIIIGILTIILFASGYILLEYMKLSSVSVGEKIPNYDNPRKALLIVDIQKDITERDGKMILNLEQTDEIIKNTNLIIEKAAKLDFIVVYITNEFEISFLLRLFTDVALEVGSPGAAMDPRVKKINNNHFIKSIMDSFSNPELDNFLNKNRVNHLYFTGLDAENCVDKTVKAAFKRNYKVTVISDAVASGSDKKRDNKLLEFKEMGADIKKTAELFASH